MIPFSRVALTTGVVRVAGALIQTPAAPELLTRGFMSTRCPMQKESWPGIASMVSEFYGRQSAEKLVGSRLLSTAIARGFYAAPSAPPTVTSSLSEKSKVLPGSSGSSYSTLTTTGSQSKSDSDLPEADKLGQKIDNDYRKKTLGIACEMLKTLIATDATSVTRKTLDGTDLTFSVIKHSDGSTKIKMTDSEESENILDGSPKEQLAEFLKMRDSL